MSTEKIFNPRLVHNASGLVTKDNDIGRRLAKTEPCSKVRQLECWISCIGRVYASLTSPGCSFDINRVRVCPVRACLVEDGLVEDVIVSEVEVLTTKRASALMTGRSLSS